MESRVENTVSIGQSSDVVLWCEDGWSIIQLVHALLVDLNCVFLSVLSIAVSLLHSVIMINNQFAPLHPLDSSRKGPLWELVGYPISRYTVIAWREVEWHPATCISFASFWHVNSLSSVLISDLKCRLIAWKLCLCASDRPKKIITCPRVCIDEQLGCNNCFCADTGPEITSQLRWLVESSPMTSHDRRLGFFTTDCSTARSFTLVEFQAWGW